MTTRIKIGRAAVCAAGLAVAAMAADTSSAHHMPVLASIAFAGSVLSVFAEWAARIGTSRENAADHTNH